MCHRHLCSHKKPLECFNSKNTLPYNIKHAVFLHSQSLSECGNVKFSDQVETKIVSMLMDMTELPCLACVEKERSRFPDCYTKLPTSDVGIDSSTMLFDPYVFFSNYMNVGVPFTFFYFVVVFFFFVFLLCFVLLLNIPFTIHYLIPTTVVLKIKLQDYGIKKCCNYVPIELHTLHMPYKTCLLAIPLPSCCSGQLRATCFTCYVMLCHTRMCFKFFVSITSRVFTHCICPFLYLF